MAKNMLGKIKTVSDLKKLPIEKLSGLCEEIREFIIQKVSKTGGHLGASLGAVDLTVALHYFFDSPSDKIIWDVGHQSYAHKILTGRKEQFHTLRQYKGISGFPKITESPHDAFGAGHASTSVSAALGFAKARDLQKKDYEVIAVIGDGAMTGGNALEAINQAGYLNTKVIVILNDNRMSISRNVGSLSEYTHRIETTDVYQQIKKTMEELIKNGNGLRDKLMELKKYLKEVGSPGLLFEKLGFNYIGPIDGHDMRGMLDAFKKAKKHNGPSLVHLRTVKGKGYSFAEQNKSKFHGVNPFNVEDGTDLKCHGSLTFTDVFSDSLVSLAKDDHSIVAITAAMPDGTGLAKFSEQFPERFFDVGIAEQHAVVFAAGMARQGFKPVCAIYSTFLQRAYDAIVHDVCLQKLPVVFAIDRAGLVGHDGPTHHGNFDLSYLSHIPNLLIMAPKDGDELKDMLFTAMKINQPVAIRYPRACCEVPKNKKARAITIGTCEIVQEGDDLAIVSLGAMFQEALCASEKLSKQGINVTLVNARFVKPLDKRIVEIIRKTGRAVIVEENALIGGFGSAVLELCQKRHVRADIKCIGISDAFVAHGSTALLKKDCGLDTDAIVKAALELMRCKEKNPAQEESLVLVDADDRAIGYKSKDVCHAGDGLLHRAFSVFIFNSKKQLLMQKRSSEKLLWPLYWSNSACSHPRKGEDGKAAAMRRAKEELGIKVSLRQLFKFQYHARFKSVGSEREVCTVFLGKTDAPVKFNPSEIKEVKYIDMKTLNRNIRLHPEAYTPWFKTEWKRIRRDYKAAINNL
jgi:1-deoxy-D-xylulose-5-phosphate synthase